MDQLRQDARVVLQQDPWTLSQSEPPRLPSWGRKIKGDLRDLWQNVSTYDHSTCMNVCESLYAALAFIEAIPDRLLPDDSGCRELGDEITAASNLFKWANESALPSSEFASFFDDNVEMNPEIKKAQNESLLKGTLALEFLCLFKAQTNATLPNRRTPTAPDTLPDSLITIATFMAGQDPWCTDNTRQVAEMFFSGGWTHLWDTIEMVLRDKLRPLFMKQRNPNITNEGRKDFHPVPLPRFDGSALDDSAKPWKNKDIYATSVLSWIVSQYKPADKKYLEAHFPLLVPAILALIDDSSIFFKIKGCQLLGQLLKTIQECGSDILIRTNLIPVFEEAIKPCLLSLPTITPEDKSLTMLGAAYPVLIALFKAASSNNPSRVHRSTETYNASLAKILRSDLISSYNHISSSTPTYKSSASFPHPKLSTFLMGEISIVVNDLGIETTKYLQDIVPLLNMTLANPFGSAYPPLLSATVSTTKSVILNAHPRVWRWRGEILAGLSACWLHVAAEKTESSTGDSALMKQLAKLTRELQSAVFVLKHALQNPASPDADQLHAKEEMNGELQKLVDADSELASLLFTDVKP
ncbi:hypothetical protein N7486_006872 [Penicillium sp. IBT 16267x]|nr:hypothetical protein N7486_006872 [Penicillium sp. IBT 16267x]